mmetsp:Transcript_55299/g.130558  ORF Transcript_55299/g.130558 Transcript_55299/m.130558 type:complete len:128 (-) Transcript_55299:81-464(-)
MSGAVATKGSRWGSSACFTFVHRIFLGYFCCVCGVDVFQVLLGFSMLLGGSPVVDLLGMLVGHVYYYFEDVAPNLPGTFYGCRLLRTPEFVRYLFEENTSAPDFRLQWGRGVPVGRDQEGDGNAHQD